MANPILKAKLAELKKKHREKLAGLEAKVSGKPAAGGGNPEPDYKGKNPALILGGKPPYVTTGELGEKGYHMLKIAGLSLGVFGPEHCKEELDIHERLKTIYCRHGFIPYLLTGSWLIPFATEHLPTFDPECRKLATEIRQKLAATVAKPDPDEARFYVRKLGLTGKELSSITDTAGGFLTGFPAVGELIELQRNVEVMARAGATEVTLPPNGKLTYPKQTGASTAYFVTEGGPAPQQSEPRFGALNLVAKKLAILTQLTNDLLRFTSGAIEAIVRSDMARVAALRMDLAELQGEGPAEPLGITNYPTTGTDALLLHNTATPGPVDTPADGNTGWLFQPQDVRRMEHELQDEVDPNAWVMRRNFWGLILDRRTDQVTGGDQAGRFVFYPERKAGERIPEQLSGRPVLWSSQVADNLKRGASQPNLTYVLLGAFRDWIRARMGVAEIVSNQFADSVFGTDRTLLRMIQYCDAGARHAQSFCLFTQLRQA